MEQKARQLIQISTGNLILLWYSSDGTPVLSQHRVHQKLGVHQVIRRMGICSEHLVQRAFYTTKDSEGNSLSCVVLEVPRPLSAGKKAGNLFTAAVEMIPVVRTQKAQGIIINAFCFDRALFAPLSKLLLQRQKLYDAREAFMANVEAVPTEVLDWCVCLGCANHDVQNSLKWRTQE